MTDEPDDEEFKRDMEIARGVMKKRSRVFRALAQIDAGAAHHEVEAELAVNMTDDKSIPALSLRGEEFLSALLLAMVQEHCTGHSPEKARLLDAAQATYLS